MQREEILRRLRERILAFAASRLGRESAEDLVQEVLLLLHQKYRDVEALEDLAPLSFEILRLKLAAYQRKAVRRGENVRASVDDLQPPDPGPDPATMAERRETLDRLSTALGQMEERCRRMFAMKLEGKTFAEIQAAMGVKSLNTIYTWDFRCRKRLRELMGGK